MSSTLKSIQRNWLKNSSREYLYGANEEFAKQVSSECFVLDAGAGEAPYRSLFDHANYETADFEMVDKDYAPSTYVCDLSEIPVEDARFDYIVFNQVMEHLPEPKSTLVELFRVLKPGGKIICTCPLFFEEHEQPYDFYRYTQFAHKHLFGSVGFEIEKIEWLEGYFGTVGYQFHCIYKYLPIRPSKYPIGTVTRYLAFPVMLGVKALAFFLAGFFYRMDLSFKFTGKGLPKNYAVVARKPES